MMHSAFYPSHSKSKLLVSTASLVIIGMIALTASAWLSSSAKSELMPAKTVPAQPTLPSQPLSVSNHQLQVERVTITPTGFDPEEISRPRGQVMWAIDNRSGLEEIRLRLDREGGQRLVDVSVNRKKLDWRKKIDLPPGRYRLSEANHPDWLCQITITP